MHMLIGGGWGWGRGGNRRGGLGGGKGGERGIGRGCACVCNGYVQMIIDDWFLDDATLLVILLPCFVAFFLIERLWSSIFFDYAFKEWLIWLLL